MGQSICIRHFYNVVQTLLYYYPNKLLNLAFHTLKGWPLKSFLTCLHYYLLVVHLFKTEGCLRNRVRDGIFSGLSVPEDNGSRVLFRHYQKEGKHQ